MVGTALVLSEATLLAFLILYRRREGGRAAFVPGKSLRELAWVLIPVVIVAFLDVVIDVRAKPVWDLVKEQSPAPGLTVKLEAFQFGWEFIYPGRDGKFGAGNELTQTTTLTVPTGQVIRLILASKDVIHSFHVPQFDRAARQSDARRRTRRSTRRRAGCLDRRASGHVDQLLQGKLGTLNQFHQRQQPLPVLGQPASQRPPVATANNLIVLLHGGSLLQSSTRFYENRARRTAIPFQVPTTIETPPGYRLFQTDVMSISPHFLVG